MDAQHNESLAVLTLSELGLVQACDSELAALAKDALVRL